MPKRARKPSKNPAPKTTVSPIIETETHKKFCYLLDEATKTNKTHDKYVREAKKILQNVNNQDITIILNLNTKKHFGLGDDNPQVVCFMEFIATFLHNLEQEQLAIFNITHKDNSEAEMHIIMKNMFNFCIEISNADTNFIRKLSLQFINIILNKMGDGSLEDELFDKLTKCVLERMQDTHHKVRVEAMFAAKRLQDPRVADDSILKAYRFHLKADPQSAVRKAALECIGCSAHTIEAIMLRTRDVDESIRRLAYERLSEVPLRSIKLKQRQELLKRALKEKSPKLQGYINQVFIPIWIQQSDNSLLNLFDNIRYDLADQDKEDYDKVADMTMKSLYANYSISELCRQLGLDEELKLIPISEIKAHSLVFWRCMATCIHKDGGDIDMALPVLLFFVDLMEKHDSTYGPVMESSITDNNVILDQLEFNSGRLELLRMLHLFDKSDEVGRNKLKEYLLRILANDKYLNEHHVRETVIILKDICITFAEWQQELLNIVTDIYEPLVLTQNEQPPIPVPTGQREHDNEIKKATLKVEIIALTSEREEAITGKDYAKAQDCDNKLTELNKELEKLHLESIILPPPSQVHIEEEKREVTKDSKELVRVFMILFYMLSEFNYRLTPELRIMQQDVIHPQMKSDILEVECWALKCCACVCMEDLELARQYFPLFYVKLFSDVVDHDDKLNLANLALQILFDLFCIFSIEDFNMQDTSEQNTTKRRLYQAAEAAVPDSGSDDENPSEETVYQGGFIEIVTKLLQDCETHSTRLIVIQGLAKLFLNNKITSKKVLGMLLLLYHHPEMDLTINNDLRQNIVMIFAQMSAGGGGGPEALVHSLIPAIKIRAEAPSESPLQQIDLFDLSKLILTLTAVEGENFHTLMALMICDELKRMRRDEELETILTRTLSKCYLNGDEQLKLDLKNYMEQLIPSLTAKISVKYLKNALQNLEEQNCTVAVNDQTTPQSQETAVDAME